MIQRIEKKKSYSLVKLLIISLLTLNTLKIITNLSITKGKFNYIIKKDFFYFLFL